MSLHEFLLRITSGSSNWLWINAWKLRPAERYSWLRLVLVVIWKTGRAYLGVRVAAAFLASLDSNEGLSSFGREFIQSRYEFLALFTAELFALQAVVQGVLARLSWNRRAAHLQVMGNPDGAEMKRLREISLLGYGSMIVYGVLIWLLVPLLLFHAIEDVRGSRAYRLKRAEILAAGECLEFSCLVPPAPRPDENFFATPFWERFQYQMVPSTNGRGKTVVWKMGIPNSYRSNFALPKGPDLWKLPSTNSVKNSAGGMDSKGQPLPQTDGRLDLAGWAETFRELKTNPASPGEGLPPFDFPIPPKPGKPAEDVLVALSKFDGTMRELSDAAQRPRSAFPIHFDEGFEALLPHLAAIKSTSLIFQLRAAARMEAGDIPGAFADVRMVFRLADSLSEDPLLISQLVRIAIENVALKSMWFGLADHRWSDAQLVLFQSLLASRQVGPALVHSLEGERAGGLEFVERFVPSYYSRLYAFSASGAFEQFQDGADPSMPGLFDSGITPLFIPAGWLRMNQLSMLEGYQALILAVRSSVSPTNQNRDPSQVSSVVDGIVQNSRINPFSVLTRMLLPALEKSTTKANVCQTCIGLGITACALERYHLVHGEFPPSLDALGPHFTSTIPVDWMNGQPLHYQRTDDGWFKLWSVGSNGKDEGGIFREAGTAKDPVGPEIDIPWPRPIPSTEKRIF